MAALPRVQRAVACQFQRTRVPSMAGRLTASDSHGSSTISQNRYHEAQP